MDGKFINSANLHAYAFTHPLRRTTQWEIVLNHTVKEITCLWLGKQTPIPHNEEYGGKY